MLSLTSPFSSFSFCSSPSPPSLALNTTSPSTNTTKSDRFPIIVIFHDLRSTFALRAICDPNPLIFRLRATPLGLSPDCHIPGICRRIFSNVVFGFSGEVTNDELTKVQKCMPRAIWYRELDGRVHKAEDASMMRRVDDDDERRRRRRRQLLQLSQQQQQQQPVVKEFQAFDESRSGLGPPIDLNNITGMPLSCGDGTAATCSNNNNNKAAVQAFSSPMDKNQSLGPILWNLDRIDQLKLPLNNIYSYGGSGGGSKSSGTGTGVTIYTIDSGIYLDHQEFKQASKPNQTRASYGYNFVDDNNDASDCDGHGTHVSATAAGLQVGVAKNANIVSVRILDCTGSGSVSDTVAALDWVAANARKPAVAALSLGISVGSWSRVLEDAVRALVNNYGVTVVVASGNSAMDACYVAPANVPEVITVGATDLPSKYNSSLYSTMQQETLYTWSNTGPCVDIFAPGVDIYSACGGESRCDEVVEDAYAYASGTSMAVPVAALYLESNPNAQPSEVMNAVTTAATQGVISNNGNGNGSISAVKPGTPNKLVYSKIIGNGCGSGTNGSSSASTPQGIGVSASGGP